MLDIYTQIGYNIGIENKTAGKTAEDIMIFVVFEFEWFDSEKARALGARITKFHVFDNAKDAKRYSLSTPKDTTIETFDKSSTLNDFMDFLKTYGYFLED